MSGFVHRNDPGVDRLLKLLLDNRRKEWYGYELFRQTGAGQQLIYEVLRKLHGMGYLSKHVERGTTKTLGHVPRTYYKVTSKGVRGIQDLIASK